MRSVWAGDHRTCAVVHDGTAWCWGGGTWPGGPDWSPDPIAVPGVEEALRVEGACALTEHGEVFCWGGNDSGQLGDGTMEPRDGAVRVHGIDDAVDLFADWESRCAVRSSGKVSCWGRPVLPLANAFDPDAARESDLWLEPRDLAGWDDVAEVGWMPGMDTARGPHACVRRGAGSVECVGVSVRRDTRPGHEPDIRIAEPLGVAGLEDAVELDGACALRATGEVICWPLHFPVDTPLPPNLRPEPVLGLTDVVDFDGSEGNGCALLGGGKVVCWGGGAEGQLGNGGRERSEAPVEVLGLDDIGTLARGADHACAGPRSGGLWCWGRNHLGELGDRSILLGTHGHRFSTVPVQVVGLP